jgi:hypothetical protein
LIFDNFFSYDVFSCLVCNKDKRGVSDKPAPLLLSKEGSAMKKPNLPDTLPDGTPWAPQTIKWFEAWRESPMTNKWDGPQWQYMFDTAMVHTSIWAYNNLSLLAELRIRETQMGLLFDYTNGAVEVPKQKAALMKLQAITGGKKAV